MAIDKGSTFRRMGVASLGFALLLLLGGGLALRALAAPQGAKMVVFSAGWCAACRELVPAIQQTAGRYQVPVFVIDVDMQQAPKDAKGYGLSIPQKELPQAYLIEANRSFLLFDGDGYQLGQSQAAQQRMGRELDRRLGK